MCGNRRLIRLMQVLADVNRFRMVGAVPLDRNGPVVRSPENFYTGAAATGRPSAKTGEQIDCCGHGASYAESCPALKKDLKEFGFRR